MNYHTQITISLLSPIDVLFIHFDVEFLTAPSPEFIELHNHPNSGVIGHPDLPRDGGTCTEPTLPAQHTQTATPTHQISHIHIPYLPLLEVHHRSIEVCRPHQPIHTTHAHAIDEVVCLCA